MNDRDELIRLMAGDSEVIPEGHDAVWVLEWGEAADRVLAAGWRPRATERPVQPRKAISATQVHPEAPAGALSGGERSKHERDRNPWNNY